MLKEILFFTVSVFLVIQTTFLSFAESEGVSQEDGTHLITPIQENLATSHPDQTLSQNTSEPYISRTGKVSLNLSALTELTAPTSQVTTEIHSLEKPKLMLSFFPLEKYYVDIDYEHRENGELLTLQGRLDNADISTFSMTVADNTYIISFQDILSSMSYRVIGSMESGIGSVKEVDLKKIPAVYDGEPLVPPVSR